MRIIINIDEAKDPDRPGKKTVRVRTGYYFSSGDFYRIRFEILQPYMRADGVNFPMMEIPRMKEKGCKARIVCHFTREQIVEAFKNAPNGPDINDPVFRRSPYTDNCNGGDCQRHKLGAEPCTDCPYCDERGNV